MFRPLRHAALAAHTAAAAGSAMTAHAAAHLARITFRTVVGGDIAAVIGVGAVAVQRRIPVAVAGQVQGAAVDGDKTVGAVGKSIRLPSAKPGTVRTTGGVETVVIRGMVPP